jgi:transcriptional regulator with XRE-family HTH domain
VLQDRQNEPFMNLRARRVSVDMVKPAVTGTSKAWFESEKSELSAAVLSAAKMTGSWLKGIREENKLTQEELAKILDVQRVTISRAENKPKVPRMLESLIKLALREGRLKLPYQEEASAEQTEDLVLREEPPEDESPQQRRPGIRP